ncbi:MAG: hypothetical protein A3B74_02200 [Candidatus Kerfeldbacteria bacterium RIFCSPHIGHO2_02_FULL_42_14]|uniref:Tyrosine specific protein phosphatases domain-containing protein n=1 Tax=Candidatus Kerfeldbacteria bacterium RIFCSPHIGHO2_02_FULL_42_14 TaxID=1798540 RepID=A0A1G2AUA7_9BACT|nr:MAG: hypothetical protein A3B74_02200 [Candidatus Kerfeldbacteria bacterium RIFCSPHIGHO2_02_FULL_42_14]OGY80361.1 MAG: hypothetical protein A3E60_04820 [Candidatus Kerfeldbacteria bacterium RIFCSPHIGHO2_12_FULL_42_13]OGY83790.1 MAG: hypothetical protein A3I91_04345 [Candidatus Kerfeldbacteria bacterium RIFCSPLOWO2_02_FULL_42_19]OGY87143.1 MAG: hypothetical protein A3G01_04665 [Candidatus Kerfeldbacteria bacterium RIFCSPLOWO2_12_FULL_43_9]
MPFIFPLPSIYYIECIFIESYSFPMNSLTLSHRMFFLSLLLFPLLLFYKFGALIILTLLRLYRQRFRKLRWFDSISDQIVIGGAPLFPFHDNDFLDDINVTAVLNVCTEYPPYDTRPYRSKDNFLHLRILDRQAPSLHQLKKGVRWLDAKIDSGEKILVHCALGEMRSVLFVVAWLIYRYRWDLDKAVSFVKSKRPQAHLNHRQLATLREFNRLVHEGKFTKEPLRRAALASSSL